MVPSPRKRSGKENVKNADKNSNDKGSNSKTTKSKKRNAKAHGLASQDQVSLVCLFLRNLYYYIRFIFAGTQAKKK